MDGPLPPARHSFVAWAIVGLAAVAIAAISIGRVEEGKPFLLPLRRDAPLNYHEAIDAKASAAQLRYPAIGVLVTLTCLAMIFLPGGPRSAMAAYGNLLRDAARRHPLLLGFYLATQAGDFLSTWLAFERLGIDGELHPALRLMAYAYGRTTGLVLGKLIQLAILLAIACGFRRWTAPLLLAASAIALLAVIGNVWQLVGAE